ncbi:MAG: MFS transporter [Acidimicrobiales bacterium]
MRRRTVFLLQCATGIGSMSYGTMFTIIDDLRDRYGVSESRLGMVLGVGFLAGFVSNVFLAPFADRGHAKRMIMIGIAVQLVGNTMFAFSQSFGPLFLSRAVMGIGGGMIYPAVRRIIILADPPNMGRNLGRMLSFDVGGFTLGPVLSAVTVGAFGLASPFLIISVLMAAVGAGLLNLHVTESERDNSPRQRLAFDLFRIRPFTGAIVIGSALFVMIGTFDALWSLMMEDMDAAEWVANVGISLFALPMLFLGPVGGRLTQQFGPFRASISGLLCGAALIALYGTLPSPYPMVAIGFLHGIVDGLTVTGGSSAIAMVVPHERLAAAQGMQGATQTVLAGIASVAAGASYGAFGRTPTFLACAVMMVLFIATGAWLARGHLGIKGSDAFGPVSEPASGSPA